jgi:mannose-6-phosphate isomerase-like protein (cupin superfamily)
MTFPVTDTDLPVAHEDVFHVTQLTNDTELAGIVAADLVAMDPGQRSGIHRHNDAETVLYFLQGHATVVLDDEEFSVTPGTRVRIGKAVFHGVVSHADEVQFISVQSPPILDAASGRLDFERKEH